MESIALGSDKHRWEGVERGGREGEERGSSVRQRRYRRLEDGRERVGEGPSVQ